MLYKGEAGYTDSDKVKMDLESKVLRTIIVSDEEQEKELRSQGYVSLPDLMAKRPTLSLKR